MRTFGLLAALLLGAADARAGTFTTLVHDPVTGLSIGQASSRDVIVQFAPNAADADRAALHAAIGAQEIANLGTPGLYSVALPLAMHPDVALRHYAASPLVRGAYPNHLYHPARTTNDPQESSQYSLTQMNVFGAWDFEVGASSSVTVAIMDTGVESTHEDLAGKYDAANSRRFCPGAGCAGACTGGPGIDIAGHGTETAGVAAALGDNGLGVAGVAWHSNAKIVSLRVFLDDGTCADDAALIAALNYATTLSTTTGRRTVVNMSLGECTDTTNPSSCGACNAGLVNAVSAAVFSSAASSTGTVLVAAGGNLKVSDPFKNVECPAKIPGVIAVGATDAGQNIASFSAQGPEMITQGVVAPGVNIQTTAMGNSYTGVATGTSFSSPNVAGVVALMLSKNPALSPASVLTILRNSADLVGPATLGLQTVHPSGGSQGAGRVNANSALVLTTRGLLAFPVGDDAPIIFPNPYHPSSATGTTIVLSPNVKSNFKSAKIYAMDGRLVRTLVGLTWDGKNDNGTAVATGTYVVLITTDGGVSKGKVSIIR